MKKCEVKNSREFAMKSVIDEMCFGLRGTYESVRTSEKYFRLMDKVCKADNKLIEKLKDDEDAAKLYEQFKDAIEEASSEESKTFYKEGFRFGVLLGIEISEEKS